MSEYVALEALEARQDGSGEIASETSLVEGVRRKIIVRYLSEADQDLQTALLTDAPNLTLFDKRSEISLVAEQQAYDVPGDCFADGEIRNLEYSSSGETKDYQPLDPLIYVELDSYPSTDPDRWALMGSQILLSPPPKTAGGKIRVTYPRQLDELKLRAGQIQTNNSTTITLKANGDNTNSAPSPDHEALLDAEFVCVVDRNGVVKHYSLPVSSYSDITGIITGTFTGLTFTANDYVVVGEYARTHSPLPAMCKRYRLGYAAMRLQMKKSDADLADTARLLANIRKEIVDKLRSRAYGVKRLPQGYDEDYY